jgi:hypothetical protein
MVEFHRFVEEKYRGGAGPVHNNKNNITEANADNVIKQIEDNPDIPKEKKSWARRVWDYSKEKHLQLITTAMALSEFFFRHYR